MKNLTENLFQLFADFTKDATLQVENGNKAAAPAKFLWQLKKH